MSREAHVRFCERVRGKFLCPTHLKMRHYDPKTGRFLQPDPIGYGDGLNLYQFAYNNPNSFSDQLGLSADGSFLKSDTTFGGASLAYNKEGPGGVTAGSEGTNNNPSSPNTRPPGMIVDPSAPIMQLQKAFSREVDHYLGVETTADQRFNMAVDNIRGLAGGLFPNSTVFAFYESEGNLHYTANGGYKYSNPVDVLILLSNGDAIQVDVFTTYNGGIDPPQNKKFLPYSQPAVHLNPAQIQNPYLEYKMYIPGSGGTTQIGLANSRGMNAAVQISIPGNIYRIGVTVDYKFSPGLLEA